MTNVLLWVGPVSAKNLAGAVPPGWTLHVYNRPDPNDPKRLSSNTFRDWAGTLGANPLETLAPGARRVILAGFSAAHGATEVLLQRVVARGDTRLEGVLSCDSYYAANGNHTPKPGHLAWLQWVIGSPGGRRAWFTTSTQGGPGHMSASESFADMAHALGMTPNAQSKEARHVMPAGAVAQAHGPVVWLDYGTTYRHVEHATKLAPAGVQAWFRNDNAPPSGGGGLALFALLALWGAYKLIGKGR